MAMAESFLIATERTDHGYRLAPVGELDIATAPLLEAAFEEIGLGEAETIVVDLSDVSFIDSTGIQLLLRMNARCSGGERLEIVASPAVERLLDITGLREQLPLSSNGSNGRVLDASERD
jgi:anti-sigma B factor antagonist